MKPFDVNTVFHFIGLGVLSWLAVTVFHLSREFPVVVTTGQRLEAAVNNSITRREFDAELERMKVEITAWRGRMSKIEAEQARQDLELFKLKHQKEP